MKNFCVKKAVVPVADWEQGCFSNKRNSKGNASNCNNPIIQLIVEEIFIPIEEIILITNSKKGSIEEI